MKLYLLPVLLFLSISLASASFITGNATKVETDYAPGDKIAGWLNISLQDESANSSLTAFSSSINILDFLKNNGLASSDYSCSPSDCQNGYAASGMQSSKTFTLDFGMKKIVGLKILGDIKEISGFSMDIASNAGEYIYPQLFIDILDDDDLDWNAYSPSGNFGNEVYGCYNSTQATEKAEITQTEYCENITVQPASVIKIGADISRTPGKDGDANLQMVLYDGDSSESCDTYVSGGGKISCIINLTTIREQNFFACIKTKSSADGSKFSIAYEQNKPCGFSEGAAQNTYDFAIFAQAGKYSPVGSFTLNDAELGKFGSSVSLANYISAYIDEKYSNNCTGGCIIPIKITSGKNANEITLSNAQLTYQSGIITTTRDIYDLDKESAKISMGFKKLDLGKAGLSAPSTSGGTTLILKLGSAEILRQDIKVAKNSTITSVFPLNPTASIPVKFVVLASGNITSYKWNFGDGTKEESTTGNSTYHTYSKVGTYSLKVTAISKTGESSKTFTVVAKEPKEEINRTLAEKESSLNSFKKQLSALTAWYKEDLKNLTGLTAIESTLSSLSKDYKTASTSEDYSRIMSGLNELDVPDSLKISKISGDFFPDKESINPGYLIDAGASEVENPSEYVDSIITWFSENIDAKAERELVSLHYPDKEVPFLTAFALRIVPKTDLEGIYLIIDRNYGTIKFKDSSDVKAAGAATAIIFSELNQGEEKSIEFLLPEKLEIMELPLYISPEFSKLSAAGKISPCNNNKICEEEIGETKENCLNDCHSRPWGKIILWMLILLFIAFVAYIALQEWYKKHYESHLFKNKNDLFNLINFIINAKSQGFSRREIIEKLKGYKWRGEQISYAFKKVEGRRTGMWEIPVFRMFEKKKLQKELEKRRQLGAFQYPPVQRI